jgi:hypothetical protein
VVFLGAYPGHPPEPADVAKRRRLQAIECKVLEIHVVRSAGLLLQEGSACTRPLVDTDLGAEPENGHSTQRQRLIVGPERFGEENRGLGAGLQIARMLGELRKEPDAVE